MLNFLLFKLHDNRALTSLHQGFRVRPVASIEFDRTEGIVVDHDLARPAWSISASRPSSTSPRRPCRESASASRLRGSTCNPTRSRALFSSIFFDPGRGNALGYPDLLRQRRDGVILQLDHDGSAACEGGVPPLPPEPRAASRPARSPRSRANRRAEWRCPRPSCAHYR